MLGVVPSAWFNRAQLLVPASTPVSHASTGRSMGAAAQHVRAADRFAREIVAFLNPLCAARSRRLNGRRWAAIKRTAVSFMALLCGAVAHERRAIPIERIERGMKARGAGCGSSQRCLKPNAYEGRLCCVLFLSAWFNRGQLLVPYQRWSFMPRFGDLSALPPNTPL